MKKFRLGLLGKIVLLTGGLTILTIASSLTVNLLIVHKNTKDAYVDSCVKSCDTLMRSITTISDPNNGIKSMMQLLIEDYENVADNYDQMSKEEITSYQKNTSIELFGDPAGIGLSFDMAVRSNIYRVIVDNMQTICNNYSIPNAYFYLFDVTRNKTVSLVDSSLSNGDNIKLIGLANKVNNKSELAFYHSSQQRFFFEENDAIHSVELIQAEGTGIYHCYVSSEIPLSAFNQAFNKQLLTELAITVGSGIFLVIIYAIFAKFFLIRNFKKLTKSTSEFVAKMKNDEPLEIIETNVKSHDEVKDLSDEFMTMQHSIIDYVDNIKAAKDKEQQFNTEVEIASKIQLDSLPDSTYFERNIEVRALINPAKAVGGDFYDYFFIDKDHLAFVIADVSGKGIPASLFMMRAKERIKAACHIERSLADVFNKVNNSLYINNKEGYFVTVFLGVLDVNTYKFDFINAGHERPFIKHKGKLSMMKIKSNFVLGLEEDFVFEQESIQLDKDDEIFMYTDGLNEAINKDNEEYGYDRIQKALDNNLEIKEKIDNVINDLKAFRGCAEQFDDITILTLKIRPEILNIDVDNPSYEDIEKVTNQVSDYLEGSPIEIVSKIGVIIDDAMNNIISYGKAKTNKKITIQVEKTKEGITLIFMDNSHPFNPLKMKNRTVQENMEEGIVGGLGISIIRSISKDTQYYYSNNKNILIIKM